MLTRCKNGKRMSFQFRFRLNIARESLFRTDADREFRLYDDGSSGQLNGVVDGVTVAPPTSGRFPRAYTHGKLPVMQCRPNLTK